MWVGSLQGCIDGEIRNSAHDAPLLVDHLSLWTQTSDRSEWEIHPP
jgi:hypothetical protein